MLRPYLHTADAHSVQLAKLRRTISAIMRPKRRRAAKRTPPGTPSPPLTGSSSVRRSTQRGPDGATVIDVSEYCQITPETDEYYSQIPPEGQ